MTDDDTCLVEVKDLISFVRLLIISSIFPSYQFNSMSRCDWVFAFVLLFLSVVSIILQDLKELFEFPIKFGKYEFVLHSKL